MLVKHPPSGLDLEATLDSGQVFGFRREAGEWVGRIGTAWVALGARPASVRVRSLHGLADTVSIRGYLDLDRDLVPLYSLLEADEPLRPALRRYRGLRLIRQDRWEALAGFILSANNNVKRIQGIWRDLSERLGSRAGDFRCFPEPEAVARCHEALLRELGLGYRAPYLSRTAMFLRANPESLDEIARVPYAEAHERVMAFPGIGAKVADCALLYGFQKYEAFPVDVWILRVMRKLYFRGRGVSEDRVRAFARKRWGPWAGYVQQYLFHGVRHGVL